MLNTLNFYWFGKMIEAVKKRFRPARKHKVEAKVEEIEEVQEMEKVVMNGSGHKVLKVEKTEVRRRKG